MSICIFNFISVEPEQLNSSVVEVSASKHMQIQNGKVSATKLMNES